MMTQKIVGTQLVNGEAIKALRLQMKQENGRPMSQQVLSEKAFMTREWLTKLESGNQKQAHSRTIKLLADALGCEMKDIIY